MPDSYKNTFIWWSRTWWWTCLALVSATVHADQLAGGFLFGTVLENGEPVPYATVTVEHLHTGLTRTVIANSGGTYRVAQLPAGTYDVLASTEDLKYLLETVEIVIGGGTRSDLDLAKSTLGPNNVEASQIEEVLVKGSRSSDLQASFGEVNTAFHADEIDQLPIARDVNAVINMAPGTVLGDPYYSSRRDPTTAMRTTDTGLVSIHGASIAENVYYVDGMNVSNLANGLGASVLPFEFYDQVQMVTGGLRAQFGRTTGGMVNAVTKSGTNEWMLRMGYFMQPKALQGTSPDTLDNRPDSYISSSFSQDETDRQERFISVAGPLAHDRLYVFGIYEQRIQDKRDFEAGYGAYGTFRASSSKDPFLGAKLDWDVQPGHRLSLTYFSDKASSKVSDFRWHEPTNEIQEQFRLSHQDRGGDTYILRYVGSLTNSLSASAVIGLNTYDYTNRNPADTVCPVAIDRRGSQRRANIGCWVNRIPRTSDDTRQAIRFDAEYFVNDAHLLNFGFDHESNATTSSFGYSGPRNELFSYFDVVPGQRLQNGSLVPEGTTELVQHANYRGGGEIDNSSTSFYIEDEWLITDWLNVRFGLRHERYTLGTTGDSTLLRIDDQWAPRIAVALDFGFHGTLVSSFSRYHIPMPSSLSLYTATGYVYSYSFHTLGSEIAEDGSVEFGTQLGPTVVYADGSSPKTSSVVDAGLDPMYQQEFTLGYTRSFRQGFVAGVDLTYRNLKQAVDDIALIQFLQGRGGEWNMNYFITNPGTDLTVIHDWDGDGVAETLHFEPEDLGYPRATRKYYAVEFFVDKQLARTLYLRGSYTWSHSYGNHEGLARTDLHWGHQYTGASLQWDFLGLTDGAHGNLPNDRRHSLKLFGVWQPRASLQTSFSWSLADGRPRNAFGVHPTDQFAQLYGALSYFNKGVLSPRGSLGRTDWVNRIDVGIRWTHMMERSTLTLRLDVFNVLDEDAVIAYDDRSQLYLGQPNPNFGLPSWYQQPRYLRAGLTYELN